MNEEQILEPITNHDTFADQYKKKHQQSIYPTEWIVRTLLGSYPELKLDKSTYAGAKILDVGFGDGRNFPLLHNAGFEISGVETNPEIINTVEQRMAAMGIPVDLKPGSNAGLPFDDNTFDYILASFSWYYLEKGTRFIDNIRSYCRVLKPGGWVIATLAAEETFIFKNGIDTGDGHIEITNDVFGMRNGEVLKCFYSREDVQQAMSPAFDNIGIGHSLNDYYGLPISYFMFAGQFRGENQIIS